jgi:hypothetical protein
MAGYCRLYVIGGLGGFLGADGVNPIDLLILVGDADRQWLEPQYCDKSLMPPGRVRVIVPAKPNDDDALLDACIAFCPQYFSSCPSMGAVASSLGDTERLDFNAHAQQIPALWATLREEARPLYASMNIWQADLTPLKRSQNHGTPKKH